jgi:two-component system LytT family response regulator
MIRSVIIDDEDHVRANLKSILGSTCSNVDIVGEGFSVASATQVINDKAPELVFLDIDLTDGSGFNVLEQVRNLDLNVIFVTAFNNFAIKAFRYNALDYILKPIDPAELKAAVQKVSTKAKEKYVTNSELANVLENLNKKDEDKKLVIRNSNSISYVKVKEIVRCEADGNYTTIHLKDGKTVIASKPLKTYESLLPEAIFFRTHQSHLINLNYVAQFSKVDGEFVVMEDQTQIAIARRRKEEFFEKLERIIS